MSKYVLGTNKYVFDSTFWGIDPQYIQGLNLWRQYPGIPEPRNVTSFGAILPIVATQNEAAQSVNISFSIIVPVASLGKIQFQIVVAVCIVYESIPTWYEHTFDVMQVLLYVLLREENKCVPTEYQITTALWNSRAVSLCCGAES